MFHLSKNFPVPTLLYEGTSKKYSIAQINHARELLKTNTYANVVAMTGISRSTLKRINKEENLEAI
jgi:DNA invertase Pin-like site-specific DNA recombinase